MKQILLVDDEISYYEVIKELSCKEYNFIHISDPKRVILFLKENHMDLILMDWNLGKESGVELLKNIKNESDLKNIPVIMVTGNSSPEHIVEGLDSGADDYLPKPFNLKVLFSRIKANIRKSQERIKLFNETKLDIYLNKKKASLKNKEFLILKALISNPQKVFTRKELNNISSGKTVYITERTVDTYIRMIRLKMQNPRIILSVPRAGYRINPTELKKIIKNY